MTLETFKKFVKNKPILQSFVSKGEMTWQDFYDIYELYGEENNIWDKYLKNNYSNQKTPNVSLKDMIGMFKNIDMAEIQNSINSIQKGISYIEELVKTKEKTNPIRKSTYEARPLYRYFDD